MKTQYNTLNQIEDSKLNRIYEQDMLSVQDRFPRHTQIAYHNTIIAGTLAFCIPAVLFLMLCAVRRITPFGDRTILYEDMKQQ